jgi:hypothetical protein
MYCPNCHEPIEDGATYCGNCGSAVKSRTAALGASGLRGITPSYALALPMQHAGETQALLSVLLGITGLAGTLFIPFVGLCFGVAGVVLGTVSRVYVKRTMHILGLGLSCLAIVAGLAAWAHAVRSDPRYNSGVSRTAPASKNVAISSSLSTPCYSLDFVDELNISRATNSCTLNAFNGRTLSVARTILQILLNPP